jgi:glycosyltransferase involved in cell wall biosynthesis
VKTLQVPFCFYPDAVGGTEVYVEALCRELLAAGVDAVVAAPGRENAAYDRRGLAVRRYAVEPGVSDPGELYGPGDAAAAAHFAGVLDEVRPDVVHLHALTRGVSLRCVREAKKRSLPVVFTYHTPTITCQRGNLLRWGDSPCDGKMRLGTCASCAIQCEGVLRAAAAILGGLPAAAGRLAGRLGLKGGVWTGLRMTQLVSARHRSVRDFFGEVDRIVAVCDWVRDLLLLNGVAREKIVFSRQGIARQVFPRVPSPAGGPLRLVFMGRFDASKGLHLLLQALRRDRSLDVRLDVYGTVQDDASRRYAAALQAFASGDARVAFREPVPQERLSDALGNADFLAVPSQWLESGPLVVLEAFAAGVPVLGAKRGGVEELVRHGVDGWLVEASSVEAWTDAVRRLSTDRALVARLRGGVREPRSMSDVAREMIPVYQELLAA